LGPLTGPLPGILPLNFLSVDRGAITPDDDSLTQAAWRSRFGLPCPCYVKASGLIQKGHQLCHPHPAIPDPDYLTSMWL
jgi:hypothetical protein